MKHHRIPATILILCLFGAGGTNASDDAEYDSCLLDHLKGTKLDAVSQLITQSCNQNFRQHDFINSRERSYNQCLLDNLAGVESIDAMSRIMAACRRRSEDVSGS